MSSIVMALEGLASLAAATPYRGQACVGQPGDSRSHQPRRPISGQDGPGMTKLAIRCV